MAVRRLIVCFDGTWSDANRGGPPTNVVKLTRAIRNVDRLGIHQVTFYDTKAYIDRKTLARVG